MHKRKRIDATQRLYHYFKNSAKKLPLTFSHNKVIISTDDLDIYENLLNFAYHYENTFLLRENLDIGYYEEMYLNKDICCGMMISTKTTNKHTLFLSNNLLNIQKFIPALINAQCTTHPNDKLIPFNVKLVIKNANVNLANDGLIGRNDNLETALNELNAIISAYGKSKTDTKRLNVAFCYKNIYKSISTCYNFVKE